MIGRSLALLVSLLIGAMLLGISPGLVIDVHATRVTAFTCTASANPGTLTNVPCMAPGATVCEVSAKDPSSVFVTAPLGGVGKAVCENSSLPLKTTAFCSVPSGSTSCSGVCPSTTSCVLGGVVIPPTIKGNLARCVAFAVDSLGSVTTTCTFFEK